MSRTKRLREEVRTYLEENDTANTVEIFDHLNDRFRWGATMNQVGNILAKDSRFSKIGPRSFQRQHLLRLRLGPVSSSPSSRCLVGEGIKAGRPRVEP